FLFQPLFSSERIGVNGHTFDRGSSKARATANIPLHADAATALPRDQATVAAGSTVAVDLYLGECAKSDLYQVVMSRTELSPAESPERRQQRFGFRHSSEHATLHLDHLDRMLVVRSVGGAAAILEQQTFEPTIVGLAHRRVNADIGGDAGQHQVGYAPQPQHQFEIGGAKRALAGLVDNWLAGKRRQFGDDLPAWLVPHEDAPAWAGIADAGADAPRAPALVLRQIGEVGSVALAGVEDMKAGAAHRRKNRRDRLDRRTGKAQIVSHAVDIAADPAEIGLHVDHDQRRVFRQEITIIRPRIRIGRDIALRHRRALVLTVPITTLFS